MPFDAPPLDAYLPGWVLWGQLILAPLLGFVVFYTTVWVAAAIAVGPRPLPDATQWPEQGRRFQQVAAAVLAVLIVAAAASAAIIEILDNPLTYVARPLRSTAYALGALAALQILRAQINRRFGKRSTTAGGRLRDLLILSTISGIPLYAAALAAGLAMPDKYNEWTFLIFECLVVFTITISYGGHLWLLRRLGVMRLAGEQSRVRNVVEAVSPGKPPTVYELHVGFANAFALIGYNAVTFSTRLAQILDDDELKAIAAHEVAHLEDPKLARLLKLGWFQLAAIMLLVQLRPAWGTWGDAAVYGFGLAAAALLFAGSFMSNRVRRQAEKHADSTAAAQTDSAIYARALETIYRDGLLPVGQKSWLGHPALYDRMLAAGVTPEYPRPAKPSQWRIFVALVTGSVLLIGFVVALFFVQMAGNREDETAEATLTRNALFGGSGYDIRFAAETLVAEGRHDFALAVVAQAVKASPESSQSWLDAAIILAKTGRHDEADAAIASARQAWRAEVNEAGLAELEGYAISDENVGWIFHEEELIRSLRETPKGATD